MKKSGEKQDDKQNNGIVSFRLNTLASNIFAIMASVPLAVMPRSVKNSGPNYFDRLPEDIIRHVIASYLNPADKLNLALLYKENLRIMKPELRLSNFLHCVAKGQQDEAEHLNAQPMNTHTGLRTHICAGCWNGIWMKTPKRPCW